MTSRLSSPFFLPGFRFSSREGGSSWQRLEKAAFAGGCFWCIEAAFEGIDGVVDAVSGYMGGTTEDPTYEEVCAGRTGHLETVEVTYDPAKITYCELLHIFWGQIDPTDEGGQFADRGTQYGTAIFYHTDEQRRLAEESRQALDASGRYSGPVKTRILKASTFYRAEEYHQDYHGKNPARYRAYRLHSGREQYVSRMCASGQCPGSGIKKESRHAGPDRSSLRARLTPLQYEVTQENATEAPFANEYWDNRRDGIYVDVVSGEVLFSSRDKFESGCGWPSFTKPLEPANLEEKADMSHGMSRTEVRSRHADSHLGHVFDDGPAPTGRRYCINSASLRFIPREDLEKEGYGQYLKDLLA